MPTPKMQSAPSLEQSDANPDFSSMGSNLKLNRTQIIWLVVIATTGVVVLAIISWLLFRYTCTSAARAKGLVVTDGRDHAHDDLEAGNPSEDPSAGRDGEAIELASSSTLGSSTKSNNDRHSSKETTPTRTVTISSPLNGRRVVSPYTRQASLITHEPSTQTDTHIHPLSSRIVMPISTTPSFATPQREHAWPLPAPIRPLSSCPPSPRLSSFCAAATSPKMIDSRVHQGEHDARDKAVIPPIYIGAKLSSTIRSEITNRKGDEVGKHECLDEPKSGNVGQACQPNNDLSADPHYNTKF